MFELLLIALFCWALCGIGAAIVGSNRGANGCLWFGLGVILGPIGVALAFAANNGVVCSACRKQIHPEATKCPHCQSNIIRDATTELVKCGACWSTVQPTFDDLCPKCKAKIV